MPEFKLISGHFGTLKEIMNGLPSNTTIHAVISQISKRFPTGIFYLNLWPFGRTLLVVTTPSGAAQVQDLNLSKPDILCKPLDTLTGGPSLMSMHGATWKRWRSLFNSGFSAGYMIRLTGAIADEVEVFCTLLRERVKKSEVFQLEEMTLRLTMDTIGSVVL
jgi:cytochrome P450